MDETKVRRGREPSLHQLRLFLLLVEELHFGRAAARAFVTQPAFSQQIRTLESRVCVDLVDRANGAVRLTEAGEALVAEARLIAESMARINRIADRYARELRGRLVLGAIGAEAAMPYTEAILAELRERHPALHVEMYSLGFTQQIHALANGDVDAAFLRPPLPPGFRTLNLATERRVACLSADDPLATQREIRLAQLNDHVVVDVPADVPRIWWNHWTINPRPDGTPVRYGPVVSDIEPMLLAVAQGRGITFLPAAARRLYPRPGIAYLDIEDAPLTTAALAWLPGRPRAALSALLAVARTIADRMQGP